VKLHGGWIHRAKKRHRANLPRDCSVDTRLVSTVKKFAVLSKMEPGFALGSAICIGIRSRSNCRQTSCGLLRPGGSQKAGEPVTPLRFPPRSSGASRPIPCDHGHITASHFRYTVFRISRFQSWNRERSNCFLLRGLMESGTVSTVSKRLGLQSSPDAI
jgi:hypothetical protein